MNNIMLDLETYGTNPGCGIVSIGACYFDDKKFGETFYEVINFYHVEGYGFETNASTLNWWKKQSNEARKEYNKAVRNEGIDLRTSLLNFQKFVKPNTKIWGNSAAFDNEILKAAYKKVGLEIPWKYYNDRCYRTLKNLKPEIKMESPKITHHALYDAIAQAEHAMEIFEELGL